MVLNTFKAAADLFGESFYHLDVSKDDNPSSPADRCSNIYNSRPRLVMAGEILSGGLFMPLAGDITVCVVLCCGLSFKLSTIRVQMA